MAEESVPRNSPVVAEPGATGATPARSGAGHGVVPALELIRSLACLEVFLGHAVPNTAPKWITAWTVWGSEAVMVFFVLSGLVIAMSQARSHRGFVGFMGARIRRLVPIYLVAVALSCVADGLLAVPVSTNVVVGHLLFLQTGASERAPDPITPEFASNGPLWSLSFEFYFYLFYAFTIGRQQRWQVRVWWMLGFVAMALMNLGLCLPGLAGHFQAIVAYSPIWLLGTTLLGRPLYFRASLFQNLVLFSLVPVIAHWSPSWNYDDPAKNFALGLVMAPLLYSFIHGDSAASPRAVVVSWVMVGLVYAGSVLLMFKLAPLFESEASILCYAAVPPVVLLLLLAGRGARLDVSHWNFWQQPSLMLGRMSYALYVIHLPILLLLAHDASGMDPFLRLIIGLLIVLPTAWLLEYRFQKKALAWVDGLLKQKARA